MTNDLKQLAARVEAATEPDKLLNLAIANAIYGEALAPAGTHYGYTSSLDAAAALVPEGWYWMAGNRDRVTPRAYVENGRPAFVGMSSRRNPERLWFEATAYTPALALTAAALRARALLALGHANGGVA